MEWWGYVILVGNTLASVLAWVVKLRWSKEFSDAKNETIKSKDAQIATLEREIKGIRENKDDVIKVKESQIDSLKK